MNDLLQLKGSFQQRPSKNRPGFRNIPKNAPPVTSKYLTTLSVGLEQLGEYWKKEKVLGGALIDVRYTTVVAKSNRISGFFSKGQMHANSTVVGARFSDSDREKKHIITHFVHGDIIDDTIEKLSKSIILLNIEFKGSIDADGLEKLGSFGIEFNKYGLTRSTFCNIIADSHYVEGFGIPDNRINTKNQSIITIYKTSADAITILQKIGIDVPEERVISDTTMLLRPPQITILTEKAPYLIAMATEDISKLSYDDVLSETVQKNSHIIDSPNNEPTIGVIDTMFDTRVYFSEWVKFKKMIDDEIPLDQKDYEHGTAISSIIVDGPVINPDLDDGCGRFKVRHFGVAAKGQYSAFTIMKLIEEIVEANPDIKVWNLSLGSDNEINLNSISPEAAILDKIQYEKDIIFIIAGTNNRDPKTERRIGAPADSINSIVVNSVNSTNTPASYSRKGLVLSFFNKPDVCSYGGDMITEDFIRVCEPNGEGLRTGTSFAAPWITRKVAYLIEVLGLSRETAKALIVDSASGWSNKACDQRLAALIGHGIVPKRIEDIIKSPDDEIRFIINGVSEMYDTYNYKLPVPIDDKKYPFVAKATLCYFPKCSINQGVDYTNTELDVYLGRVHTKGIKTINRNTQSVDDGESHYMYEGDARKFFRKWDNTKHIQETFGEKLLPRKAYDNSMWGISVKTKERLGTRDGDGIKFGLVVTLKEIYGINRINDFIHQCELQGWLVNRIDLKNRLDIYAKAQENIIFDV
ncbi:MAG: S8 family peptidase [Patescibacteria group bacterium]|jgi:hypothetical protein